jgi:septal ring factor EnvC (AmiA/AmiB activator)
MSYIAELWKAFLRRLCIATIYDIRIGVDKEVAEDLASLEQRVESVSNRQVDQDRELEYAKRRLKRQEENLAALRAQIGVTVPRLRQHRGIRDNDKSSERSMDFT